MHRRHLRAGTDPAELAEEADGVVADASQLTDIVEDLLLAADQRPGALTEPIDLARLATDVADAARPAATEQGVTVRATAAVEGEQAMTLLGTHGGLRRALVSLVDNAVRHAAQDVLITMRRDGRHVVVDVTDDGPGVDPEILPHLFERFASAAPGPGAPGRETRRRYGIGLALVSEIAQRHGGTVSAHAGDAGGAVLRLTLPAG
jgi:signal transduction histidine kinase